MEPMNNWEPVAVDGKQEITSHREPGEEFMFYRSVAAGLIDAVQDNCSRGAFENMEGAGKLSDNPVTNLRYHFVVTAAMITRFCMEGGMAMEEAFGLSDEYREPTYPSHTAHGLENVSKLHLRLEPEGGCIPIVPTLGRQRGRSL